MQTIAERLDSARKGIDQAATSAHRPPNSVKLLAVSKTKPVSDIMEAYEAGQRMFGENYVQEGVEKVQELSHLSDIEWHMIGPIQSNKTKVAKLDSSNKSIFSSYQPCQANQTNH